jgi:hypothetical protein
VGEYNFQVWKRKTLVGGEYKWKITTLVGGEYNLQVWKITTLVGGEYNLQVWKITTLVGGEYKSSGMEEYYSCREESTIFRYGRVLLM